MRLRMAQGKIVLMACGSFSPPTYMHCRMFEIARDHLNSLGLHKVIGGIFSPVHDAYGKKELVSATHRLHMLRLALKSSNWIKVSEWETQQEGWTRTRVSLHYHQETLNACADGKISDPPSWIPDDVLNVNTDEIDNIAANRMLNGVNKPVTVKLLCGADLLESFATPGLWSDEDLETIVGKHGLVVVTRAGGDPERFIYESDMLYKHRNNITLVKNWISNEVSSTVVRRQFRRGESVKYLTDDGVIAYVRAHGLYGATLMPGDKIPEYDLNDVIEYRKYDISPQDISMTSPEETNFNNILISIRDRPSIVDETVTVKRKKPNFLIPNLLSDIVSPKHDLLPKRAFVESSNLPGKAVKIRSSKSIDDDKVSRKDSGFLSLDSYLVAQKAVEKRRTSASGGNIDISSDFAVKKRFSSHREKDIVKSKSEVNKLCDKMKNASLKSNKDDYKTRSCNDVIRLLMNKHGIQVLSDREAIV